MGHVVMNNGIPAGTRDYFVIPRLMLFLMALLLGVSSLSAQQKDIGGFDINKVRKATQYADTGLADTQVPDSGQESMVAVAVRIILYLGVVIVLIFAVSWFFKRKGMQALRGGGGAMDIIETLPTGQNRMLLIVRILDEIYLVAQTVNSMTLLDKISGQKAMDIISSSKGGGTVMHFKDAFNSFMGKMKKTV